MNKIKIIEASRPLDDRNYFDFVQNLKLHKNTKFILCNCKPGMECPNNPNKKLCGAFSLCSIPVIKE
jgi:hypothetical protein